jgi:hypothetical protein
MGDKNADFSASLPRNLVHFLFILYSSVVTADGKSLISVQNISHVVLKFKLPVLAHKILQNHFQSVQYFDIGYRIQKTL